MKILTVAWHWSVGDRKTVLYPQLGAHKCIIYNIITIGYLLFIIMLLQWHCILLFLVMIILDNQNNVYMKWQ